MGDSNDQAGPAAPRASEGAVDQPWMEAGLFRAFFDNAPVGKCMTALDGRLLRVNRAFCEMLGLTAEKLQGRPFAAFTHPDDLAVSAECAKSLLAGERDVWDFEKRYLGKDGRVVWTRVAVYLHRDATGSPLCFVTRVQV